MTKQWELLILTDLYASGVNGLCFLHYAEGITNVNPLKSLAIT